MTRKNGWIGAGVVRSITLVSRGALNEMFAGFDINAQGTFLAANNETVGVSPGKRHPPRVKWKHTAP